MPATWPIQLQELSLGGLAFTSPYPMEVGRTASVRATAGRRGAKLPDPGLLDAGRAAACPDDPQYEVGAVFLPLDDSSRRALEMFLKLSPAE